MVSADLQKNGGNLYALASTNNALPDDSVTASKYVGAVLTLILM
jgi:hypothetical protein